MKKQLILVAALGALSVSSIQNLGASELGVGVGVGMNTHNGISSVLSLGSLELGVSDGYVLKDSYKQDYSGATLGYAFDLSDNWEIIPMVGYDTFKYMNAYTYEGYDFVERMKSSDALIGLGLRYTYEHMFISAKVTHGISKHDHGINIYATSQETGKVTQSKRDLGHAYSVNASVVLGVTF